MGTAIGDVCRRVDDGQGDLTVPVVVEVEELVVPLRDDPYGILDESADDQEAS